MRNTIDAQAIDLEVLKAIAEFLNDEEKNRVPANEPDLVYLNDVIIVDHGSPGNQTIGDSHLSPYNPLLPTIGNLMKGTVVLRGCKVAQGEEGEEYLQQLADKFGRPVSGQTEDTSTTGSGASEGEKITKRPK